MCESCLPRITRRQLLGGMASGMVVAAAGLGVPGGADASSAEVAPGLSIRPRAAWAGDDRPPTASMPDDEVLFLLVHHTASANGADPVTVMRSAYDFHTGPEKGWPDVAYNFFVDQDGVVWEGRAGSLSRPVAASATGGSQGYAQLVCLLGDFTDVLPTAAALASLNRTLAWLADRYDISTDPGATVTFESRGSNKWPAGATVVAATISGHRDMSATACPGDTFYPYLIARVPSEVQALRSATNTPDSSTAAAEATVASTTSAPSTEPADTATTSTAPATTVPATTNAGAAAGPTSAAPGTTTAAQPTATTAVPAATAATTSEPPAAVSAEGDSGSTARLAIGLGAAAVAVASGAVWYTTRRAAHEAGDSDTPSL